MSTHDPLLADIQLALDLYGLSVSKFGYLVAGDPALVSKMKQGRRIKNTALRKKILDALARVQKEGKLA